ncbi:hypothetical protein FRC19_009601 [Serendipita sp. 401]|nr:hypothetical protein FRC19_009601 [Serendipita sp. 401]
MTSISSHRRFSSDQEAPVRQRITTATGPIKRQSKVVPRVLPDQAEPTSSTAQRVIPKKSKLNLGLLVPKPSLSTKLSQSKLTKEKENSKNEGNARPNARDAPPSAFHDIGKVKENNEKQERRRSFLGGSASKLGGLGSLVRHASIGLLRDVTNNGSKDASDASQFVDIGVEDVPQEVEDPDQTIIDIQGHIIGRGKQQDESTERKQLHHINDPDIAEIMVVKRAKSRTSLDTNWLQETNTAALTSQRDRVRDNGVETDVETNQKRNSGWWAKKTTDGSEARPKARRRLSAILTPSSTPSDLPPKESSVDPEAGARGSLVIRAIRSVRSLAQVQVEETKPKAETNPEESQAAPPPVESVRRIQKKPAFVLRRPSDSVPSQDFGGFSSDHNRQPSRLVPSTRRRVSAQYHAPSIPVSEPVPAVVEPVVTPETEVQAVAIPRPRKPIVNPENRVSVVSILSIEESDAATADVKANRRSSTGSNIRWDPEAMSQQARKVRQEREERLKVKLQLERERVQNGLPPNERLEKKAKSLAAKKRTPLVSIFDNLDISAPRVIQQAAAWPPAAPSKDQTSLRPTDLPVPSQRERTRTSSSSNTVPPSAFNLRLNLEKEKDEASLTLRTLRSEQGNVSKKAQFYGDLERRATLEPDFGVRDRRTSHPQNNSLPSSRSRQSSFPAVAATAATVSGRVLQNEEILEVVTEAQAQPDSSENPVVTDSPGATPSSDSSTDVFVYTGVDAQSPKPVSIAPTSEYSFCNEFSSYDEVSKTEIPSLVASPVAQISPPVVYSGDIFSDPAAPKAELGHRKQESVVSVESDASYCVVSKHAAVEPAPQPLVLHKPQVSIDSTDQYVNDTFAFASKKNLFPGVPSHRSGVIRPNHRRNRSVVSVSSAQSRRSRVSNHSAASSLSLNALSRPSVGDKMMLSRQPLPDISSSSLSLGASTDSLPTNKITLPSYPSSPTEASVTSVESFFDRPRTRMPSTNSVFSLFGIEPGNKPASRGNLFGHRRPMSLISNYSDLGVISDEDERGEGQQLVKEATESTGDRRPVDQMLQEEIEKATVPCVRALGMGHLRQDSIAEALEEGGESAPVPSLSPPRSRESSTTTDSSQSASSEGSGDHSVAIAEPEVESNMVLRRYYAFQREAQEALEHSHTLWQDTPFSADELSEFEPPTEPEEVKNFLTESRRYYMELPNQIRARRRALAAPYPASINAMLEDKPASPVDNVFKDISTWDHRVRKVSDGKGRTRKLSEEKSRTRKVSEEKGRARKVSQEKVRVRKVSEKRTGNTPANSNPSTASNRAFKPFVDATSTSEDGVKTSNATSTKSTLSTTTNSVGRTRSLKVTSSKGNIQLDLQLLQKLQENQPPPREAVTKENVLQAVEGMLESPTGSLRIPRPRPKRRGTLSTTSPPPSIRL